jgi:hypothetical protein
MGRPGLWLRWSAAELKRLKHGPKIGIRSGFSEGHSPAFGARGLWMGRGVPGSLLFGLHPVPKTPG